MDTTMAEWTREELEALYPDGTVSIQVDDTVTVMSTDEWSAWIDQQVGTEKPEEDPPS
jgi:trans-2-enoyl-CoA reductase